MRISDWSSDVCSSDVLPALSLGLWHNFGDSTPIDTQRSLLRTAFDLGINHFDLANNYGPPYGSAEINFGRLLREDFKQRSEEHTSELQSLMRISYAVFCLKKKKKQ